MMVVRAVVSLEATVFWYERTSPELSSGQGRVGRRTAVESALFSGCRVLAGEEQPNASVSSGQGLRRRS